MTTWQKPARVNRVRPPTAFVPMSFRLLSSLGEAQMQSGVHRWQVSGVLRSAGTLYKYSLRNFSWRMQMELHPTKVVVAGSNPVGSKSVGP